MKRALLILVLLFLGIAFTSEKVELPKNQENLEAVKDVYIAFKDGGYTGTLDGFRKLLKTNKEALDDAYKVFKEGGYGGSSDDFEVLMGVVKSEEDVALEEVPDVGNVLMEGTDAISEEVVDVDTHSVEIGKNWNQTGGNPEALAHALSYFKTGGYNGNMNDFVHLINTNEEALTHAYQYFVDGAYNGDINDFRILMGVEKQTGGNPKALNIAFNEGKARGYNGSIDDFKNLINTNDKALNLSHQIFVDGGYNGDINDFRELMGVEKQTGGNPEAIKDAFILFKSRGYKKSQSEFEQLISTNNNALEDAFILFKSRGYKKGKDDFRELMGVEKQTGGNPDAISQIWNVSKKHGYRDGLDVFTNLMATDESAVSQVWGVAKKHGYRDDLNKFKRLVGFQKKNPYSPALFKRGGYRGGEKGFKHYAISENQKEVKYRWSFFGLEIFLVSKRM